MLSFETHVTYSYMGLRKVGTGPEQQLAFTLQEPALVKT